MRKTLKNFIDDNLWLGILMAALVVSGYSLYWYSRQGMTIWHIRTNPAPLWVAVIFSASFDGVALLAAIKSVKAAKDGRKDGRYRTRVFLFCALSIAFNLRHGMAWAVPPLAAVVAYDLQVHEEREKAKARHGARYPTMMPSYDLLRWLLFPISTLFDTRDIVRARARALTEAHKGWANETEITPNEALVLTNAGSKELTTVASVVSLPKDRAHVRKSPARRKGSQHSPRANVRTWAKEHANAHPELGWNIGDRARLPAYVYRAYEEAHREEATGLWSGSF